MEKLFQPIFLGLFTMLACSGPIEQKVQIEEPAVAAEPSRSSDKTKEVLERHLNAFVQNDLEAIVADYTDESIIMTPDSTYKGLEQISAFFSGLLPSFPTEGTSLEVDKMVIENELAYIIWHAATPTLEIPFGTDTFIVEEGKIQRQTFAGVINPVE